MTITFILYRWIPKTWHMSGPTGCGIFCPIEEKICFPLLVDLHAPVLDIGIPEC